MLNPIFWKKVQGQKHPGRWGIVDHQIPSIKVSFKTNAKSRKHPGIKLLSSESKTQLVNQRKKNSYRNAYIYINIFINTELLDGNKGHQEETHHPTHRFRRLFLDLLSMGWRGCASINVFSALCWYNKDQLVWKWDNLLIFRPPVPIWINSIYWAKGVGIKLHPYESITVSLILIHTKLFSG